MLKIIAAATLALSFAACSKDSGGGLASLKKEACACKDAACAKAVNEKMDKYMDSMTSIPSSADMAAVGEAAACLAPHLGGK
jgi:hypothetical protein